MSSFSPSKQSPLSLLALSSLAVGLPLLDLFGRYPNFFVAKDMRQWEIIIFGFLISFAVPLIVLLIDFTLRPTLVGRLIHTVLIMIFGILLTLAVLRKLSIHSDLLVLSLAGIAGCAIAYAEQRWLSIQKTLNFLVVAPLAALGLFLFISPASRLIWSSEPEAVPIPGIGRPAPIVMLVFDEFPLASLLRPDGTINEGRFPNFARLARETYWFRNASSVSPWTGASITSALTGSMPVGNKPASASENPRNLFTLLGGSYRMSVHEELTHLCPGSVCTQPDRQTQSSINHTFAQRLASSLIDAGVVYAHATLPPGWRTRLPSLEHSWGGFLGQDTADSRPGGESPTLNPEEEPNPDQPRPHEAKTTRAQVSLVNDLIGRIEKTSAPTLYFTHVVLPHFPWSLTPSGRSYEPGTPEYDQLSAIPGLRKGEDIWGDNSFLVRQGLQRHLLQVGTVDRLVGNLIDRMKAIGIWDQTMVIIFADHGVSFIPNHPRRGPTPETQDEIYRVPLFIKLPSQSQGEIRDDNAMLIDVLPTLVDALDIQTDWSFSGRSLFSDTPPPAEKRVVESPDGKISSKLDGLLRIADRNNQTFHGRLDWSGIACVGRFGDLVGRPLNELNLQWIDGVKWSIDQLPALRGVDLASGYVPILISGHLSFAINTPVPNEILVIVNGKVAGIGGVYDCHDRECLFSALLAEGLVHEGTNEIEVKIPAPE